MRGAVDLRFFVSGGAGHGLGHVLRAIEIAREALDRGVRVAVALRGDAGARTLVRERLPAAVLEDWCGPEAAARPAAWAVFDTREPIADELGQAARAGLQRLVLDRADHLDDAELTVLPHLHGRCADHPRLRRGAPWCVIPRELRRLGPAEDDAREGVLVSFGGADPHDLTSAACEALAAQRGAQARREPVHVVLGRCFGAREALLRRLRRRGWSAHFDLDRRGMALLMRRSAAAVVGFGITVYELAWLGVPMLYLVHHESDVAEARALEALGIGAFGGSAHALDGAALRRRLAETVLDPDWRRQAARTARTLLGDGEGAVRIVDALLEGERRAKEVA